MIKTNLVLFCLCIHGVALATDFVRLEKALAQDQLAVVQKLVTKKDIDSASALGETPLMLAVRFHAKKSFQWLLLQKPKLNLKNSSGETALTQVLSDDSETPISFWVSELVKAGADIHLKGGADQSAIDLALQKNDHDTVKAFAVAGATWLNEKDSAGKTPLVRAAQAGQAESVEALGEMGADPNIKDNQGKSALDYAKKQSFTKTIKILNSILTKQNKPVQK